MLDIDVNRSHLIDAEWLTLESKAELTESPAAFFERHGPVPVLENSRRRFHRYYARTKALLYVGGATHGIYVRDVSRSGIGFISPVQLFPRQRIEILLVGNRRLVLENVRCRRQAPQSYECGANFLFQESGQFNTATR